MAQFLSIAKISVPVSIAFGRGLIVNFLWIIKKKKGEKRNGTVVAFNAVTSSFSQHFQFFFFFHLR